VLLTGAQPASAFERVIDAALVEAASPKNQQPNAVK
jgi:hypothetical protein